jgi:hypothetical protein
MTTHWVEETDLSDLTKTELKDAVRQLQEALRNTSGDLHDLSELFNLLCDHLGIGVDVSHEDLRLALTFYDLFDYGEGWTEILAIVKDFKESDWLVRHEVKVSEHYRKDKTLQGRVETGTGWPDAPPQSTD